MASLLDFAKQINENEEIQTAIAAKQTMQQARKQKSVEVSIFKCQCQYKNNLESSSVFKQYYLVIDTQYKCLRIYNNEQELNTRSEPKYKLELENAKLSKSHNMDDDNKNFVIIRIKQQIHTFNFNQDEIRQNVLDHINECVVSSLPSMEFSKSMPNVLPQKSNDNQRDIKLLSEFYRLETFAKNNNAEGMAKYINDTKDTISAKHIFKINLILNAKDYKFLQDFVRSQGLTYLCILSIMHQLDDTEMISNLLTCFETIINIKFEIPRVKTIEKEVNDDNKDQDDENEKKGDKIEDDEFQNVIEEELIGYNLLKQHSDCVQCITDCFENKDKKVKSKVMRLLTTISISDDDGFEAVLNALYSYGDRHDASSVFDEFVRSMYFEEDLEFRRDALKFVNVILNICPDLEIRIESRHFLTELGFDTVIDQLWEIVLAAENQSDKRQKGQDDELQLNAINEDKDDDEDDENEPDLGDKTDSIVSTGSVSTYLGRFHGKRKSVNATKSVRRSIDIDGPEIENPLIDDIRQQLKLYQKTQEQDDQKMLWNQVNLNDPDAITQHLFNRAMHQNRLSDFIHTLVSMCTIPDDR